MWDSDGADLVYVVEGENDLPVVEVRYISGADLL